MEHEEFKEEFKDEAAAEVAPEKEEKEEEVVSLDAHRELNNKYLRLYAELENYKKRTARERQEILKFANESLILDLLPSIDNLGIALRHAGGKGSKNRGIEEGVANTLRELQRTLEKFGVKPIEALYKPFNPEFHHAMSQVEREDIEEGTVVEEFRKGYMLRDKVLRASLVAVSKRPAPMTPADETAAEADRTDMEEIEIINGEEKEES